MTTQQEKLIVELRGLKDQIEKGHFMNVHFRAFRLANDAWEEHVRQNAERINREAGGLPGAMAEEGK